MVVGPLVHTERGRTDGCTTAMSALVHNGHKRAGAPRSRAQAALCVWGAAPAPSWPPAPPPLPTPVRAARLAGVELAASISERLRDRRASGNVRVQLLTPGAGILEGSPAGQREAAAAALQALGVEVVTGERQGLTPTRTGGGTGGRRPAWVAVVCAGPGR